MIGPGAVSGGIMRYGAHLPQLIYRMISASVASFASDCHLSSLGHDKDALGA